MLNEATMIAKGTDSTPGKCHGFPVSRLPWRLPSFHLRLANLQNVRAQRIAAWAKDGGKDTLFALDWIRKNPDKLEDVVYDPMRLILNVKDPRYAKHVESCMTEQFLKVLSCQTRGRRELTPHRRSSADPTRITAPFRMRSRGRTNASTWLVCRPVARLPRTRRR